MSSRVWQPPLWFDRLSGVAWRVLVVVGCVVVLTTMVMGLSSVILPLFLGLLFASAMSPVSGALRNARIPPGLSAISAVFVLMLAFVLVGWLTIRAVVDQWPAVQVKIDEAIAELVDEAADAGIDDASAQAIADDLRDGTASIVQLLATGLIRVLPVVVSVVATLFLSLLVCFFYLKDGPRMWAWVVSIAGETQPIVDRIGRRVWATVTGFVLGQTAIAAIDATLISLGALVLGVPNVGTIAVLTFFGSYIPFVGATLSGLVAVLLAVADGGVDRGILMLIVVLAVQALEGNVLQPWIQGRAVRLHPLVVALAITVGGAQAGILGVFLAVPVTAAIVVSLAELRAAGLLGSLHHDEGATRQADLEAEPGAAS